MATRPLRGGHRRDPGAGLSRRGDRFTLRAGFVRPLGSPMMPRRAHQLEPQPNRRTGRQRIPALEMGAARRRAAHDAVGWPHRRSPRRHTGRWIARDLGGRRARSGGPSTPHAHRPGADPLSRSLPGPPTRGREPSGRRSELLDDRRAESRKIVGLPAREPLLRSDSRPDSMRLHRTPHRQRGRVRPG